MKFQRIFSIALLFLFLIGCSKDDPGTNSNGVPKIDKSANLKALGSSANDLLSDVKYTSINVEIVYVTGYAPTSGTLANLKEFLSRRTHKPDGINITTRAIASSGKAPFSIEEIAAIESENRIVYTTGDEISVFVYIADGSKEGDDNNKVVLGSAFRNTSLVIFGKTVQNISDRTNAPDKTSVESTTFNHEFGHLFGLVDKGSPMQVAHEDSNNPAHCNIAGCLMSANAQFGGSLTDFIDGNNIPRLEDLCAQDLIANGGK
ncbi:hypothetical protein [Gillisia sp. Hel_I_29]|uniref:hypothetical protein n=1 Tax=Gillisia sp. Hel_I_29 TaxID=1249975 RepID=UPI0005571DE7|nr:hypothetical protein [Gillisia sp. Hel_I_29]